MTPTELLFGKFPRTVAASAGDMPNQTHVFSQGEFDIFLNEVREKKNVYSSISKFPLGGQPVADKVPFDFDSPNKDSAFPPTYNDCQKIEEMRDDPWLASTVLGDVLSDAKEVAKYAQRRNIPSIAVYSGLGIHYYLLYQPEKEDEDRSVKDKMKSTNARIMDMLGLETNDTVVAQPERILRVPNCRRVSEVDGEAVPCDMWTIPLLPEEIVQMDAEGLLEAAKEPRELELDEKRFAEENRPSMKLYEDYLDEGYKSVDAKALKETDEVADAEINYLLENQINLPCIAERVKQRDPDHDVRFMFAVQLFNLGFSVEEAVNVIRELNWVDFEEEKTRGYLTQIYEHGYSRWSCRTIMNKGYCVYPENPSECPSFMEAGEPCRWKQ